MARPKKSVMNKEVQQNHKDQFAKSMQANLSYSDLEFIGESIRDMILQGQGVSIEDYMLAAKSVTQEELGYRRTNALIYETKIDPYFPDEVYAVLHQRAKGFECPYFNDNDDDFIREHRALGSDWLASKFYVHRRVIYRRAKDLDIELIEDPHMYTAKEEEFIINNMDEGIVFLSSVLGLSKGSVKSKRRRIKNKIAAEELKKSKKIIAAANLELKLSRLKRIKADKEFENSAKVESQKRHAENQSSEYDKETQHSDIGWQL